MQPDAPTSPLDVTRADRVLLRLLQLGGVVLVLAVIPLEAYDLDRFFVPKEGVLHLVSALAGLLAWRHRNRLQTTWIDGLLIAFLLISGASAILATNPWLATRALALTASGIVLFWAARSLPNELKPSLLAGLVLMTAVAMILALLQAYGFQSPFFSDNRVPGGTLGNRNFVGHWAAFGLPLVLLVVLRASSAPRFLLAATVLPLLAAALILTRSRAAWIGVLVVFGIMMAGFVFQETLRDAMRVRRLMLLLVFAGGGIVAAAFLPNALQWASDTPYLETARGVVNYQDGSGRGRLIQYRTTLNMAMAHPVLGVGPGNWPVEYLGYAAPNDPSRNWSQPGMTANPWPSSDWMALVSERGFLALVLVLLIGLGFALRGARQLFKAETVEERLEGLTVLATFAGVAAVGAFDAVLLLPWPTFFVAATLGALWTTETTDPSKQRARIRDGALLLVTLIACGGVLRSSGQLAAMTIYDANQRQEALVWAARLDPGSYRIHLRLAQGYRRDREARCHHAQAAHQLFPQAEAARQLARRCP